VALMGTDNPLKLWIEERKGIEKVARLIQI
jgi:hypothetical protein